MADPTEIEKLKKEIAEGEAELSKKKLRLATISGEGYYVDGIRDPQFPCEYYINGKPNGGPHGCESDGHYICGTCVARVSCRGCGKHPEDCKCVPEET